MKKWALITGASQGIGEEFVLELAKRNYSLVLVARNLEKLNKLKSDIEKANSVEVISLAIDLNKVGSVQKLIQETSSFNIELIILAAGFGTSGEFLENSITDEMDMIDLNCKVVVELTHHFGNKFKQVKKGGIVLFSSIVAFQGVARTAVYSATKAFIQSFAEAIRDELKAYNVQVIACAPGPVQSGFAERAKMKMGKAQNVAGIAKETLDQLGKVTTVRPGFLSKLLGYSLATSPRVVRRIIMNKIMSEMTY
ncbi:MAG: SDR family NAD(P)-dependent oxidoreductase [Leptospiraceae bacterium]|nr:SDR family NAD(P)-dependent oxidoreductase [Leptospiraceae bacterium]